MGIDKHWIVGSALALILMGVLACSRKGSVQPRLNPADGAMMAYVPAGKFLMGSDDEGGMDIERPKHSVHVPAFWIYRTPVTNGQYRRCIAAGSCEAALSNHPDNDYPAVAVTWHQARNYCEWAGGRLPTEAEWEKAARGADGRRYPWGNAAPTCDKANYLDCQTGLRPVGSHPEGASPYGVLDLSGNVWEWTRTQWGTDFWKPGIRYPYVRSDGREAIGAGDDTMRVLRGGAFIDDERGVRCACRYDCTPDFRDLNFGFRVVVGVPHTSDL